MQPIRTLLAALALAGLGGVPVQAQTAAPAMDLSAPSASAAPSRRAQLEERVRVATTPSAAFGRWINDGIGRRVQTVEETRRVLLACHSGVLRPDVATAAQAPLVALVEAMAPFAIRQRHGPGSESGLLRAIGMGLSMAGYSDEALEALVASLESPAGVRSRQAAEPLLALQAMEQSSVDLSTRTPWQWPLQPLRSFMESVGKSREFYAALDELDPGMAAIARRPDGRIDEVLPPAVAARIDRIDWSKVSDAFEKRLGPRDLDGLSDPAIAEFFDIQSRAEAVTADLLAPQDAVPETRVRKACEAMGAKECADTTVRTMLDLREQLLAARDFQNFRRRLESLPTSGCQPDQP